MSKAAEIAESMQFINEELNNESRIMEEKIAQEVTEKKPFKMSDYIKSQIINKDDIEKEATNKPSNDSLSNKESIDIDVSDEMLTKHTHDTCDEKDLVEREILHHNTREEDVKSTQEKVLKVANFILEEAGLIKEASEQEIAVEKIATLLLEEAGFIG